MRSGGERTRAILYFLGLLSATLFALLVDSYIFNWPEARYFHVAKAFACYTQHIPETQPVPTLPNEKCKEHYDYVRTFYLINVPGDPTTTYDFHQTWDSLNNRYQLLTKEYVENASLTLPIIGVKLDKGNVFVFSTIVIIIALFALKRSLDNETKCVRSINPLLKTKEQASIVTLSHIFAQPRARNHLFWLFLFVPSVILVIDAVGNLNFSVIVGAMSSLSLGGLFGFLQIGLTVVALWTSYICFGSARELDVQLAIIEKRFWPTEPQVAATC
jgi:hypothetical protein